MRATGGRGPSEGTDELSRALRMPWMTLGMTGACTAALVVAGLTATVPTGEPGTVVGSAPGSVTVLTPPGRTAEELDGERVLVRVGRTELRGTVSDVVETVVSNGSTTVLTAVVDAPIQDAKSEDPGALRVLFPGSPRPLLLDVLGYDSEV